jgi:uncharacterized protein YjbI with pentapeptide repeats
MTIGRAATAALLVSCVAGAAGAAGAQGSDGGRTALAVLPLQRYDASANGDSALFNGALRAAGRSPEELLSSTLDSVGRYAVVAPERAARAMSDVGTTPDRCHDLPCVVDLGRKLGVSRVVSGRLSKLSTIIWYVDVTLVDVPAGRVVHQESIELKGDVGDLLPKGALILARRLASKDTATRVAAASEPAAGGARLSRAEVVELLARSSADTPADLTGKDLSGLDLSGVDFKSADLSRSRLAGTNFTRAAMFGVKLSGAVAREANFTDAVLDVAVLRGTDLTSATLRGTSLYATILIGADLTGADLTGARVIGALANAKLVRATLTDARLGADRSNQPMGLMRTDLTDADLSGATLTRADLRKTNLARANLTGADVTGADVTGANLNGTILRQVRGRDKLVGLDRAQNVDLALFDTP